MNAENPSKNARARVAVITGASVGIGAAIAARFVADGARVFGLARRRCPVAGATAIEADLSDVTAITALIERLKAELAGQVHALAMKTLTPAEAAALEGEE